MSSAILTEFALPESAATFKGVTDVAVENVVGTAAGTKPGVLMVDGGEIGEAEGLENAYVRSLTQCFGGEENRP